MALILHSPSTLSPKKPYPHLPSYSKPNFFYIKSQDPSTQPQNSTQSTDNKPKPKPNPNPKPATLGFGSPSSTPTTSNSSKKQKVKRERASIIRRAPVEKPAFVSKQDEGKFEAQSESESERAFVLAWLGLGSLIILEGILLAASGFLPEEWDKFFVKYLYPSFTPTVLLFFAGTIVYGVSKYLQNETSKNQD